MAYSQENDDEGEDDHYKKIFKRYKSSTYENLASLIDCSNIDQGCLDDRLIQVKSFESPISVDDCQFVEDFEPFEKWKIYTLKEGIDGVLLVPGILKPERRQEWFEYFYRDLPKQNDLKANISLEDPALAGLRWITFGYHHDWNTKHYWLDQESVIIPDRVQKLSKLVSRFLDLKDFKTEAGIVNYYHRKSSLYFHTDHSEVDQGAPLFSLSLGTPTIFLIGGLDKQSDTPIVPILLRDSDLLVMSGQSRLALHAVPKIFAPNELESIVSSDRNPAHKKRKIDLGDKSRIHRININVRQVWPVDKSAIDPESQEESK